MVELNKGSSSNICENCDHHYCCRKSSAFLTMEEKKKYNLEYNGRCGKFDNDKCSIYNLRPVDCRIFPITIYKVKDKFYWGLSLNCQLSSTIDVDKELEVIERVYLPQLKDELNEYNNYPWDEWFQNIRIIREVKIKEP